MKQTIVTSAALDYFQPILDLSEQLLKYPPRGLVAGRLFGMSGGYALSIVVLAVVALENYVGVVSYDQSKQPKGRPRPVKPATPVTIPKYLATLRKSFRLEKSLTEVFVLRDSIVHGHLWEFHVSDHLSRGQRLDGWRPLVSGDGKYRASINVGNRRTRINGFNLVPRAIGLREAAKVLSICQRTLMFLVKANLLDPGAIKYRGRFQGRPLDFWEIVPMLEARLKERTTA